MMLRSLSTAMLVVGLAIPAVAQQQQTPAPQGRSPAQDAVKVTIVAPDTLGWKDAPFLPKGAQYVVLMGDPTKAGEMFVQRVKLPANYQIPAHTHPYVAVETVLTGSLGVGMGEKMDTQHGQMLKAGSFLTMPARHTHYAWTGNEETIVQLQTMGPGGIDYINPADDPRKAMATGAMGGQPATGTSTPPATGTTSK